MSVSFDTEFSPAMLEDRVVQGAEQSDLVRLHGALTAALNLYPRSYAYARVLAPALDRLHGAARERARIAMNAHLLQAWKRADAASTAEAHTKRLPEPSPIVRSG